ncbi:hypothetical protein M3Y99_00109800 [Aphelenchoides fujianensis]|nr:hypothetical protein M3Y99_00109800 [Aphelenchoides fujianensis]
MKTSDPVVRRIPAAYRPAVVIAAGFCLEATYGLVYSFGNMLPYLVSYLRWAVNPEQSTGSLMVLQSCLSGMPFATMVGGLLERRVGARVAAGGGMLVYVSCVFLSYFAIQISYEALFVVYGVVGSYGRGIAYVNVLTQCQKWMPQRVGVATGIVSAGFGSSAFILAPIQTAFVNPHNLAVGADGFFHQPELLERVPRLFLLLGGLFVVVDSVGLLFLANPTDETSAKEEKADGCAEPKEIEEVVGVMPKRVLFTSPVLLLLSVTLILNSIFVQITSGLFKAYGQTFIPNDHLLASVNSVAAGVNCVSRVLWGMLADRTSYRFAMSLVCAAGALLMCTLPLVRWSGSSLLFFCWIPLMFACIGGTFTVLPFGIHRALGGANFGVAYGFVDLLCVSASVITSLIGLFVLPRVGFDVLFVLTSGAMVVSLVITLLIHRSSPNGEKLRTRVVHS